jgi:spore photoproduct lyase
MRHMYRPQQIWIDRQVLDSPITANVLRQLPDVPTVVLEAPPPVSFPATQAGRMTASKKTLYLAAQQGRFVRDCPGATSRDAASQLCCGYMIVEVVYNCNYDCTYCTTSIRPT